MFNRAPWIRLVCASALLLPCIAGCFGRGPELAPVTGKVTLDGEPLEGAQVEFKPMQGNPSYGTTDGQGNYVLKYTKDKAGAVVGSHVVRITTPTTFVDESGEETQVPERVPEQYNYRSELIREVRPGPKTNICNFVLRSSPEDEQGEEGEAEEAKTETGPPKEARADPPQADEPEEKTPAEEAESDEPVVEGPKLEIPEPKAEDPSA
jgi:hypothetical protein